MISRPPVSLTLDYQRLGDQFYKLPPGDPQRRDRYFNKQHGLYETFLKINDVSDQIMNINRQNMEEAARDARRTASSGMLNFGLSLGGAVLLAIIITWWNSRAIFRPM